MSIRLKPRSQRRASKVLWRSAALLGLFVALSNIGYVLAQGLRDPQLLRTSLNVAEFPRQVDFFMSMRDSSVIPSFGIAVLVFVVIALGHFFAIGPKDMAIRDDHDAMPWWNVFERLIHAIIAVTFVILTVSGLAITFGRHLGGGTPTLVLRSLHEYSGLIFTPCVILLTLIWARHAIPRSYDMEWFAHAGGYLGYKGKLTSGKFNAGQKLWYWIMVIAGLLLVWSGLMQYLQVGTVLDRRTDVIVHFFASIPIVLMFIVHLYMTTLGTRGAFMGMINGKFSKSAAQKFHSEAPELKR